MFAILPMCIKAQQVYEIKIHPKDKDISFLENQLDLPENFPDSLSALNELNKAVLQLHGQGFLEASFDEIVIKDSVFIAALHIGEKYKWAKLSNGNVENALLSQIGFREKLYQKNIFNYLEIRNLQERLLAQVENNGHPFASVWLDSIKIKDGQLDAQIFLNRGRLVFMDTLNVQGNVKISKAYLENYLGLKQGSLYSRSKILKIRDRIRELPFLQEKKNLTVSFQKNKAIVNLFLEKKKASKFDFLIGVLPSSNNNSDNKKLLITGTFDAEMHNQFGLGERIYAAFERLRPETQELELEFNYPYILELPFGADLKFGQYRRDSTFSNVAFDVGFQYLLEGGNYLKAFWNNAFSNIITVDTNRIAQGQQPPNLDVHTTSFGLEYSLQRLDYGLNPRAGWHLFLRGGAGIKEIKKNQAILNFREDFYDTLALKSFQYQIDVKVARYFPLFQRSVIKLGAQGGFIFAESPIYQNEQFRIGGNRLLRGFDEESIFTTLHTVFSLEYRLLIGQNSYIYLFGDYAWLQDKSAGKDTVDYDQPFGFGAGLTFETAAGIFGLSLAVGSQQGNALDFQNPKIHFGYVSYF